VNVLELTSLDGCKIFTIELITYYINNFGTELWQNYGRNILKIAAKILNESVMRIRCTWRIISDNNRHEIRQTNFAANIALYSTPSLTIINII